MCGRFFVAEDESVHQSDAVTSLKAILTKYRSINFDKTHSDRIRDITRGDRGDLIVVNAETLDKTANRPVATHVKEDTRIDKDTTGSKDAIGQHGTRGIHTKSPYSTLSPSSSLPSEDAFTPDLSMDAVRELSILCVGYTRLTPTTPQTDSVPQHYKRRTGHQSC